MSTAAKDFVTQVRSWEDLARLIEHFSRFSDNDWLFRGVSDEHFALVARIGRTQARRQWTVSGQKPLTYEPADERILFETFRTQALSYVQRAPSTRLEWLALAQHHGLPTRLLDWTESLFVAVWFAVEKAGAKEADSALWVTYGVNSLDPDDRQDPLLIGEPCVYRPAHVSPRIAAQASVLMVCPNPTTPPALAFVRKVTIARECEFELKKRLNACGINQHSIFPDLQGLAEHLAWMHKHNFLAGRVRGAAGRGIVANPNE